MNFESPLLQSFQNLCGGLPGTDQGRRLEVVPLSQGDLHKTGIDRIAIDPLCGKIGTENRRQCSTNAAAGAIDSDPFSAPIDYPRIQTH
ncbi:MAG: hypothetical protein ACH253_14075 [Candidatus Thiodiazotropha sp.]